MSDDALNDREYRRHLRTYLEEICAELCRFRYAAEGGLSPELVIIQREVALEEGSYLDIVVEPPDAPKYAVEIKFGYPLDIMTSHLERKFGGDKVIEASIETLYILVRKSDYSDWAQVQTSIRQAVNEKLQVEIWDETDLLNMIKDYLDVDIDKLTSDNLLPVRRAINIAKWKFAYGDSEHDHHLSESLLWHFGSWHLRRLKEQDYAPDEILKPGIYDNVVIVMADLCSFSNYVRDTRDEELIRHSLTAFYSRSRYAIHSAGGMLYQFVGDCVVGVFGMPDSAPGYFDNAMMCARTLIDIGNSVSGTWQRNLDRVQEKSGVHIGISVGELNLMNLIPFAGNYTGFVGDSMNMAARLMDEAGPGEIIISNGFYQRLEFTDMQMFEELENVEAKNVGLIKCWKQLS